MTFRRQAWRQQESYTPRRFDIATETRRRFNRFDLAAQTQGVECRKDGGVIEEIPGACKDIDQVMAIHQDLVELVHTLKQVLCVKG